MKPATVYRQVAVATVVLLSAAATDAQADPLPLVSDVPLQPLVSQVERVADGLRYLGAPLTVDQQAALDAAVTMADPAKAVQHIQQVLDPLCIAGVNINPEGRVKAEIGAAPANLVQHGWQIFLVKVHNEAGVTAKLRCHSPNAARLHEEASGDHDPPITIGPADVVQRWLDVEMFGKKPLNKRLSGLKLEYRIVELYSRDAGRREALLGFDAGQGTQDLGFRGEVAILFNCEPSVAVKLAVIDDDGRPTTGQFVFRDARGRIYPARARRLAPDFFFHDQVYRHDGEQVLLPAGDYQVTYTRGPEYRIARREISVPPGDSYALKFRLQRWIHLAQLGWYSGDHHVHAAGCSHYSSPTKGVTPADMMRHILGEDLNVGCVLSWGPCWYYQKQFFNGQVHQLSTPRNIMRYDVEVSGFPSSHAGHLVLLRLREDDYPGTTKVEQWPSWDLPILQWGRDQGGVVGFAHSGWGLEVPADSLPTFEVPPYDGIGANEFIVDVTHDACDFISAVDTPAVWELNIWYHTLNCGFTTRISGETDFPCIYGERVGLGRAYVKMDDRATVDFDRWVSGIKDGRSYCCDGRTHLIDFKVNELGVGEVGADGRASFVSVKRGEPLTIEARAAAMLGEEPRADIRKRRMHKKPYWHVERARIGNTREVEVELIVNGEAVDTRRIVADGRIEDIRFNFTPQRSSWIALRVMAAAHTNPVFVEVDGQPIRASKRSAAWCLESVDRCWSSKSPKIRESELSAAEAAYDHARRVYRRVLSEAFDDLEE